MEPIRPEATPQHLDRIVRECLDASERELALRSLTVTRQISPDLPPLALDPALMREAIGILVQDAIRNAPARSRLRVTVKASDAPSVGRAGDGSPRGGPGRTSTRGAGRVHMVAVKCSGEGLSDVQREVLFTGEAIPGSLARARAIVDAHGGACWANGMPGRGRTCYITLTTRSAPLSH